MSPENLKNIGNFGGWGMTLVVYKKSVIKTRKSQHTILETFTKKKSLRNLSRYHGLFELEVLEIFTTDFYLNLTFFQVLQGTLLKNEKKKKSQKRCKPPKNYLT